MGDRVGTTKKGVTSESDANLEERRRETDRERKREMIMRWESHQLNVTFFAPNQAGSGGRE